MVTVSGANLIVDGSVTIADAKFLSVGMEVQIEAPDLGFNVAGRIRKIAETSTGFLYAVSRTGVTGERQELSTELREFLQNLRRHTVCPIAVGFGVSQPEHVQAVWQEADGAVVGSAIVREIENGIGKPDLVERVASLTRRLRGSAA